MNILVWIIFGGIAGWIASKIAKTDDQQGIIANILVGIVGAVLGGFVAGLFGTQGVTGFNIRSFIVAIIGAVLLLVVLKTLFGAGRHHGNRI